jgi:cytochrome P450
MAGTRHQGDKCDHCGRPERVNGPKEPLAAADTELGNYDIHEKNVRQDAECMWARMRAAPALVHGDKYGGFYFVAKFRDMREALLKHGVYSSGAGITLPEAFNRSRHIPAEIDPPLHKGYRAIMQRTLTADKVSALQPAVREIARELLDAFRNESRVEFFAAFARPLPVYVLLEFLGLPRADGAMIDNLVVELHTEVATGHITGAASRLTEYAARVIDTRAASSAGPDDDFVATVLKGEIEGRPLSRDEMVNMVRQVLIGAFDTTSLTIAAGVWWLAQHPEDAQRLRDDRSLMNTAAEEVVRFASASTYLRRTVTHEVDLGGTHLRPGDKVLLCFGAANRDPQAFANPDQLLLDRTPINHLGFGLGLHRCVGSHLAKLQLAVALTEFLSRYQEFRVDPEGNVRFSSGLGQGIVSLPLMLGPAGC